MSEVRYDIYVCESLDGFSRDKERLYFIEKTEEQLKDFFGSAYTLLLLNGEILEGPIGSDWRFFRAEESVTSRGSQRIEVKNEQD